MPKKVLMVCLGNICRSPLAEGILQSKISNDLCIVDSAGTANYHVGEAPDYRSIAVAKRHGVFIQNQKCRQIHPNDFEIFDYIYVMDKSNYANVLKLAPNEVAKQKVHLILNELYPNQNLEVPDPYFGDIKGFEDVYQLLDVACTKVAEKLK